jgi:hypothetical protein
MRRWLDEILSAGHEYAEVVAEVHYRVRHGYKNEHDALRAMHWDMKHDYGFTYLHKRNLSAIEYYREAVCRNG